MKKHDQQRNLRSFYVNDWDFAGLALVIYPSTQATLVGGDAYICIGPWNGTWKVTEIVQMSRVHAYENYFHAYNDCVPNELPRLKNLGAYIAHIANLTNKFDRGI